MNEYDKTISEIRKFNRFYTVNMGFLDSEYLNTQYSIAETRILFEIKIHGTCVQSDIVKTLHIDKSYLSRLMNRFYRNELIKKEKSGEDKRTTRIALTEKGLSETERLIEAANHQILEKIQDLNPEECDALCNALNTVISILGKKE